MRRGWKYPGSLGCGLVQGALHNIIQGISNYPLMYCICFSANMSISANKPLFWAPQQYFCNCECFCHKKTLQIIPNMSCMLFTFNSISSSSVCMSEIDGLGQPTSDDLWGLMLLYNKCKQSQKLILGRSFVPYSFVRPRHNLCNLTKHIFDNVQNFR